MKTTPPKALTKFYTIEQIAEWLAVSTRTVRRWIHDELLID
jgi:transcriptional antiterminator